MSELREAAAALAECIVDMADDVQPHSRSRHLRECTDRLFLMLTDCVAEVAADGAGIGPCKSKP